MTLPEDIREAAGTLQEVSSGLASALKIAAKRRNAPSSVLHTFREAESISLTVVAILDDASPILALLHPGAKVVGRAPMVGALSASVCNGFDSLAFILLALLRKATDAVSDVAAHQSQWLVSPIQAKQLVEAMSIHHGQLKAVYGLLHLAGKIVDMVDVEESLFLDVAGDFPRPELEPTKWRSAVKTEPLFGRFFGFHYPSELRNFLLIVNIARGSISTAAATTPDTSSPLFRNLARLGWGWLYSNMVLLNNLGVTIDRASEIGKDAGEIRMQDVRDFMNLSEDPVLTTVSSMASADVAIDFQFVISPTPLSLPILETTSSSTISPGAHTTVSTVTVPGAPISARVISHPGRPLDRSLRTASTPLSREATGQSSFPDCSVGDSPPVDGGIQTNACAHDNIANLGASSEQSLGQIRSVESVEGHGSALEAASGGDGAEDVDESSSGREPHTPLQMLSGFMRQMQDALGSAAAAALGNDTAGGSNEIISRELPASGTNAESSVGEPKDLRKILAAVQSSMAEATDSSLLATAIKSELVKLHSNVSSLLAPEMEEPASALIIHFHGGGFVSQSSAGHAVYLKEWAADLPDAVIFSVDYALAPERPYPAALDDCFYAYCWALENAERLGTRAKRVLLCGDSAGGNLAVAVALKARTHGIRAVDGICLGYPALYVNVAWSPSRLLSFFDPLLPLSILDVCLRSYIPEGASEEPHRNPFISPLVADSDALRALPPLVFICGSLDPLLDDSVQFAHNLKVSGRQMDTFRIMEGLCHGFLNMIQVSKDARCASNFLSQRMAELLEIPMQRGGLGSGDASVTAVFDT